MSESHAWPTSGYEECEHVVTHVYNGFDFLSHDGIHSSSINCHWILTRVVEGTGVGSGYQNQPKVHVLVPVLIKLSEQDAL